MTYIDQRQYDELLSTMRGKAGPFSTSTSFKDDATEFEKFIGREAEINRILDEVEKVRDTGRSRAIRLQGEGGVGKTALFNYIWRGLKLQRGTTRMQQMLADHWVEVGFITCTDELLTFMEFWRLLCETLKIDEQNFFELLLYRVIIKTWNLYKATGNTTRRQELESLVFGDPASFFGLHALTLDTLRAHFETPREPLSRPAGRDALKHFLRRAAWDMAKHQTDVLIPGQRPRKVKFDNRAGTRYLEWLVELVPDEDGNYMESLERLFQPGDQNPWLKSDGDVFKFFEWVKDTFEWTEGKPVIFLVAIDELLKPITRSSDPMAWKKFGTLLVTIRNNLKHVLWVLIDTDEEWRQFDTAIRLNTDLQSQVSGFIENNIILNPLSRDEMIEALRRRVELFWRDTPPTITRTHPAAPFTTGALAYIVDYFNKKLRKCIQGCDDAWNHLRLESTIHDVAFFTTMLRIIRTINNDMPLPGLFTMASLYQFEKDHVLEEFWDPGTFSTEGDRSARVEEALARGFSMLRQDPGTPVSDVRQNRTRGTSRRPDVHVIFFSGEGPARELYVECQVKIYGSAAGQVHPGHLDSSISLLRDHVTDALHLVSNVPVAPTTRAVLAGFNERVLNSQPLNDHQLAALLCLHGFEQLFSREPAVDEVKHVMGEVLNKPWSAYIQDLRLIEPWHRSLPADEECASRGPAPAPVPTPGGSEEPPIHRPAPAPITGGALDGYVMPGATAATGTRDPAPVPPAPPAPPAPVPSPGTSGPPPSPPAPEVHVMEIRQCIPALANNEQALVFAMVSAYKNKRNPDSITLSTLKKNYPVGMSSSGLKTLFSVHDSRFHAIPKDDKQKFKLKPDGRAFLERFKLV